MSGSVNVPGDLALGDLQSTSSIRVGAGGALIVDNSGTGAAGQVSIAGPLRTSSLDVGTSPMTCGALSSTSILVRSAGRLQSDIGSTSAPAIRFGSADSTGICLGPPSNSLKFVVAGVDRLSVGGILDVFAPLNTNGSPFACGAATCGALSSGSIDSKAINCGANPLTCGALTSSAIVSSGTASCGASALACGALNCAAAASTGGVSQPRYSLRVLKSSNQSVATTSITGITWSAAETSGGGASNWTFTPDSSLITCPVSGRYYIVFQLVIEANATGARFVWIEVNPSGGVPGSGRRYAEFVQPMPTASFLFASGGGFTYQLAAGDTLLAVAFQTSGSSLNVGLSGNQVSELSITRLSE